MTISRSSTALLAAGITALLLQSCANPPDDAAPPRTAHAKAAPSGTKTLPAPRSALPAAPFGPIVSQAAAMAETPPLRSLPASVLAQRTLPHEREHGPVRMPRPIPKGFVDPVLQGAPTRNAPPAPIKNFEGQTADDSGCNCIPPDTNGAVGTTQYVQTVNSSMAVYLKSTGAKQFGPVNINTLFSTLPSTNECRLNNDGDPVVVYDQLADRWLVSEFAVPGGVRGHHECIAISKTPDATGAYYVYDFLVGAANRFQDYPHIGLWSDGYYMATHEFDPNSYAGEGVFAFERDKMLLGQAAQMIKFDLASVDSTFFGHLPASIDGFTLPPSGAPEYFTEVDADGEVDAGDAMRIWKFHVDWTTPANSTYGLAGQPNYKIPVATFFRPLCVIDQGNCVQQKGGSTQLDPIGDRLMFRAAYRNFGDHEALVLNHTVINNDTTQQFGPRWYEVRGLSSGSTPTIFQQGTFAPTSNTDALYRWMGSVAMDSKGGIAVGYSTSSAADFPSIAYAARVASDPPGILALGEKQIYAGGGPENPVLFIGLGTGRWGDYSALTMDPSDDRTFWYTTEYFPDPASDPVGQAGAVWHTRIASFKLPDPVVTGNSTPVATLAAAPTSGAAPLSVSFTVTGTDADAGDTLTYDLDFGDASAHGTASGAVSHSYAAGMYTATLVVTDNHGASNSKTVTITATAASANTAPTASLTPASSTISTGQSVNFTVAGSDPDVGDPLTYNLDFGDGSAHGTASGAVPHAYAAVGSYTATLTVTDSHAATASKTASVTVKQPVSTSGGSSANIVGDTHVGALGWLTLLPLLGTALARRRRTH